MKAKNVGYGLFLQKWGIKKDLDFWLFSWKWPQFLENYGWNIIEDVDGDNLACKYVKPTGRIFASTPIERMIFAEKYKSTVLILN